MNQEAAQTFRSIVGKNPDKSPKTVFALSMDSINTKTGVEKQMSGVTAIMPEVNISKLNHFIVLDLTFINNYDNDFRRTWAILENFAKVSTEAEESDIVYQLSIMLTPFEYEGTRYAVMFNPIFWSLHSTMSETAPNSIRLLFEEELFGFYKNDSIDVETIKHAVDSEIEAQAQQMLQDEIRRAEDELYRAERDRKIEELRRQRKEDE